MKLPTFKNIIKEFISYVGDRNLAVVDMFKSDLKRELRSAYVQGYKDAVLDLNKKQDIFDNAG